MNHSEAKQEMAVERYLLGELAGNEVDAFEEHMFDCPECAMDVRAADTFIRVSKEQLAHFPVSTATPAQALPAEPKVKKPRTFIFWKPMFAAPAFAALLAVIAYQNVATIPRLRSATMEPRVVPWASLHIGSRGGASTSVQADPQQGAVLLIQLPENTSYPNYAFDFYDSNSKQLWSRVVASPQTADGTLSLVLPANSLQQGSYIVAVSGISAAGERTEIDRRALDIRFHP